RFNFFMEEGAMVRDPATGTYSVDKDKMHKAITDLSALILKLQGDGDLVALRALMAKDGSIKPELQKDLDRLKAANIPVDVTFEQGLDVLGLPAAR
ncbi:MAG: Zn-dependent hydrolase, partial [Flavobacteriales bacterium]